MKRDPHHAQLMKPKCDLPWKAALACTALLAGVALGHSDARAEGELRVLTWEGYTDPSFTDQFVADTGCDVSTVFVGSNDEFPAKLIAGGVLYDVISPSLDTTTIMAKLDLVEPIDVSRLEHWDDIFEIFRNHPSIQFGGEVWAVPNDWGSIPFLYRTDKFDEPPTSAAVLWDPAYSGKIAVWDDKSALYVTARMLFGADTNVYDLSDEQLEQIKQKLIEQKPLIRKYWATNGELVNLFANDEVWVANAWEIAKAPLLEQGISVEEFIPVERADGWQDAWQVVKGTPNRECVYAWLNFASGPGGQCGTFLTNDYAGVNPEALKTCMTPEDFTRLKFDDPNYLKTLDFWVEPARVEAYIEAWTAVKAAQ